MPPCLCLKRGCREEGRDWGIVAGEAALGMGTRAETGMARREGDDSAEPADDQEDTAASSAVGRTRRRRPGLKAQAWRKDGRRAGSSKLISKCLRGRRRHDSTGACDGRLKGLETRLPPWTRLPAARLPEEAGALVNEAAGFQWSLRRGRGHWTAPRSPPRGGHGIGLLRMPPQDGSGSIAVVKNTGHPWWLLPVLKVVRLPPPMRPRDGRRPAIAGRGRESWTREPSLRARPRGSPVGGGSWPTAHVREGAGRGRGGESGPPQGQRADDVAGQQLRRASPGNPYRCGPGPTT